MLRPLASGSASPPRAREATRRRGHPRSRGTIHHLGPALPPPQRSPCPPRPGSCPRPLSQNVAKRQVRTGPAGPRRLQNSHPGAGISPAAPVKMLYLIGLGLGDAKDITVKGLEVVKQCHKVYLEAYTSMLTVGKEVLEEFYGRELILADRETVEQEADNILKDADLFDVAFLVVGDPFGATTHSDLVLRAVKLGIPYRVIHNASIMNAVGCCGLQLYNFGETVSVVFWTDAWKPESFFDKIGKNRQNGMHTLCLLDIKVKEQNLENLMKGKKIYEPPRYMSVNQAAEQLLAIVQNRRLQGEEPEITEDTICVGLARVGATDQKIASGTLQELSTVELGGPLHSMIITGAMHPLEIEMLKLFAVDKLSFENKMCQRNT
ncbi:PREDICTED: diphthine methyl ester synthase isoform X1 [Gavialis gangeticus]|uniref:diphthine methyl ester synthase isoform X1 n=2 Tax=Gavialis gangeticus TaxID=94835 RepID=UPI00092F5EF6|nr:PREDICTED: diphthine methyl ester synthase isoform X1 [Gavialis gangeticus]